MTKFNGMVSTGDTAISLHIRSAPIFILWGRGDGHTPDQLNPKCQDLSKAKFFLEGGGSGVTPDHRDKCAVCTLKERGLGHVARLCSVEMPASIHMRGNYWNLTWDSREISNLYFSYITFYVLLIITKFFHDI